jgi:hypothetical protein
MRNLTRAILPAVSRTADSSITTGSYYKINLATEISENSSITFTTSIISLYGHDDKIKGNETSKHAARMTLRIRTKFQSESLKDRRQMGDMYVDVRTD